MYYKMFCLSLLLTAMNVSAEPDREMVYALKGSIAKVHVVTRSGGQGVGSAVVVAKDMVATNCHVLANAVGVNISKFGDTITPVGLKADWVHDVCILRFPYLDLQPVTLGDARALRYEQEIFSIGFPGGPPKPLTSFGKVTGLYPMDGSLVVRTSASFIMGASGSPVFDKQGQLVALSTFKSPGKGAYYYNIPVNWIKNLLESPDEEILTLETSQNPFWNVPESQQPYFMQVVLPYQNADWSRLADVAEAWVQQSNDDVEAWYYLGYARLGQQRWQEAQTALDRALTLNQEHPASLMAYGLLAQHNGDQRQLDTVKQKLASIDDSLVNALEASLENQSVSR